MKYVRIGLYVVVGLLVALLAGFLWGRAGRSAVQMQFDDAQLRLDLTQARANLLAARVDLFEVNFGRASQELQAAKAPLQDAEQRLAALGRNDEAGRVRDVAARVVQASDQTSRLDQSAHTRLAAALVLLDQVATSLKTGGPTG